MYLLVYSMLQKALQSYGYPNLATRVVILIPSLSPLMPGISMRSLLRS